MESKSEKKDDTKKPEQPVLKKFLEKGREMVVQLHAKHLIRDGPGVLDLRVNDGTEMINVNYYSVETYCKNLPESPMCEILKKADDFNDTLYVIGTENGHTEALRVKVPPLDKIEPKKEGKEEKKKEKVEEIN